MTSVRAEMIPKISKIFFHTAQWQQLESLIDVNETILFRLMIFYLWVISNDLEPSSWIFPASDSDWSSMSLTFAMTLLKCRFTNVQKWPIIIWELIYVSVEWYFYALIIDPKNLQFLFARPDFLFGVTKQEDKCKCVNWLNCIQR